jgi:hypothetical protein
MIRTDKSAVETYKYFSALDGNQHIASEFALSFINKLIGNFQIKSVLELGLGIGSICYSIHDFCKRKAIKIKYAGTESNTFCLGVLPDYLKEYFNGLQVYPNLDQIPNENTFELVIIDGKEENLEKVKSLITKHGIVLIEGDRLPQLEIIKKTFPKSNYVRVISLSKNPDYGPFSSNYWCGGVQLIFIHPTFKQKMYYCYLKIATSIKYKLRGLKK